MWVKTWGTLFTMWTSTRVILHWRSQSVDKQIFGAAGELLLRRVQQLLGLTAVCAWSRPTWYKWVKLPQFWPWMKQTGSWISFARFVLLRVHTHNCYSAEGFPFWSRSKCIFVRTLSFFSCLSTRIPNIWRTRHENMHLRWMEQFIPLRTAASGCIHL